ncbi:TAXI family TRAP transporter solute-binding subunit [Mesorhizobium sp. J428]|uniref:TAXI family TRAP transporter solute-binding subunit n=1 Tax=Mesorhizobium sp. J428 TaxID=2898440 RepID=UPI0021510257|nr:TAXI family TRAP transporter solute-binding subunit [Mesorhizobium sp. J428]MCR5857197.1 TAXI family TRAP transporter solute-binding subunit [Mesorhizobium sp. J428]
MRLLHACLGAGALALMSTAAPAADRFVTIGTGGVTGVYYPAGGAVCRLVNARRAEHGLRCSVESTGGSVFNANALKRGDLELAIIQSDFQAYAYEGTNVFETPFPEMRALFSLHGEPVQLMARTDAGISGFEALKGKRVNIGNAGSGHRVMMELVMAHVGITNADFALTSELASAEQASALCDNRIDVAFWAAGVPNGSTQEAAATCAISLVPLEGEWMDSFLAQNKAYAAEIIPAGVYPGVDVDVPTFTARATVVTRADIADDDAYEIVKSIFESLDDFKQLHPALANLDPTAMATTALTAPLHPGAERYFREKGLLQ